ncbi:MAG: type II toxin-antitoxin system HicB family antitoxin [Burkholderiales bacterium]|nr:type II toxin-antitoxin system HicB family antitoxin [Burkholderiales bacterium]
MKIQYPVLIEKGDKDTAWGVIVPDLPGCFSAADKQEDILDNVREAILLHLEALDNIPEPSSLDKVNSKGFTLGLVDIDLTQIQGPSKRINVTIPAGVLARIDAAANAKGENRSQFLTNAAIERISS